MIIMSMTGFVKTFQTFRRCFFRQRGFVCFLVLLWRVLLLFPCDQFKIVFFAITSPDLDCWLQLTL